MKRWLALFALLVVCGGGYLVAAHLSGGAFPTLGLPLGGERARLREMTLSFWEDIQFKDFAHAAGYHDTETREEVDIPFLLERLFLQKPEMLEFMDFEIVFAELDSTGRRARVKSRVKVKDLVRDRIVDKEILLFWHRDDPASPWEMKLESSLRRPQAEEGKVH